MLYLGCKGGYSEFHHYAVKGDFINVKKCMQENNLDLDKQTDDKNTAFALAVFGDHLEVFRILLKLCPDVNNSDYEGDTPLHYAVANGNFEMVAKLIEHEANVCASNVYQITPVYIGNIRQF